MKKIVCIMGKSGTGKSFVINQLIKKYPDKFSSVKSYTTRGVRVDDPEDIKTHIFVNDCFWEDNKNKAIAVYHSPKGYISWTDEDCFDDDKINLYAIDPLAVNNELYPYAIKHNIPIHCIYLSISDDIRKERYCKREGSLDGYNNEEHLNYNILKNVYLDDLDNVVAVENCDDIIFEIINKKFLDK